MTEIALTIDWGIWIPIVISTLSLLLAVRSSRNKNNRQKTADIEKAIDRAQAALSTCESKLARTEEELRSCGREKDELRREKYALLEQVARLSRNGKPPQNGGAK